MNVLTKECCRVIRKFQRKILLNKCVPLLNVDPSDYSLDNSICTSNHGNKAFHLLSCKINQLETELLLFSVCFSN